MSGPSAGSDMIQVPIHTMIFYMFFSLFEFSDVHGVCKNSTHLLDSGPVLLTTRETISAIPPYRVLWGLSVSTWPNWVQYPSP